VSRGFLIACGSILIIGIAAVRVAPRGPARAAVPLQHLVERDSPIAGPDGVLVEALGIETVGGEFTPILPRGMPLPAARTLNFGTATDGQQEIRLHLLRGMSSQVSLNQSLGWFRIGGLRGGPEARARVAVSFRVTGAGIALTAYYPADQRVLPITPAGPPGAP
jgi:molecular chaperone DnaK (HSP70)